MERQELYKIISRYHVALIQYINYLDIEELQNYIIYLDILINKMFNKYTFKK